ncbi:hypothetical protein ACFQBY_00300 [Promicromonospora citrea]|uniref:hypothetical protein n=1 Tax=Promicromonospora citrea TaxID=43677 RepID=UPI00360B647F
MLSSRALHGVRRASLRPSTFAVHVRATNPVTGEVAYEQDRVVTGARWTPRGEVVLDLEHGWQVPGGDTLQYVGAYSRNVLLELEHTITQAEPLRGPAGRWSSSGSARAVRRTPRWTRSATTRRRRA